MPATHILINVLGEIALLLWGIHMVHSGVMRAFGAELRRFIGRTLHNRVLAFGAGLGVTTLLQSSTATGMMVTSFAAGGTIALVPALAVMLGANVGTALIVQILSFDITLVFPFAILGGLIAFRRGGRSRVRDIGRALIGLGLILLALHLLIQTMTPAENAAVTRQLFSALAADPLLDMLLAAVLTWAAHSSVAIVLFIISLAGAGLVTPDSTLALVLGANLGSAVNPVLDALGGDPDKLRVPLGNLLTRLAGCAAALLLLPWLAKAMMMLDPSPGRIAANFHLAFNLVLAAVFIWLLSPLAALLRAVLPSRPAPADPSQPRYLESSPPGTASVALANAAREALRMADVVERMLRETRATFRTGDRRQIAEIRRMDDILDGLMEATKTYLTRLSRNEVSEDESRRLSDILTFTINLEHVGDIIDKNLMDLSAKRAKNKLSFSEEGAAEIEAMHSRLLDHMRLAVAVFMENDLEAARRLVREKEEFRDLERQATERHFERLRSGRRETVETSALHLDIIRDLKRIDAHIAATAHGPLERSGILNKTRLAD